MSHTGHFELWNFNLNFSILFPQWTFQFYSRSFAGWALTEGQHRPKAGKKKKTHEVGLFFLVPASTRCSIRKWVNPASAMSVPRPIVRSPSNCLKFFHFSGGKPKKSLSSALEAFRRHAFAQSSEAAPGASPGQSRAGRMQSRSPGCFSADHRCRFLDTVLLAKRCLGAGS